MKKWIFLLPFAALPALFISTTETLCACMTNGETIAFYIDSNPMLTSPEDSRTAFLLRIPLGSDETSLRNALAFGSDSRARFEKYCVTSPANNGYTCTYDEIEEGTFFSKYHDGFRINVELDSQRLLRDVRIAKHRRKT